jgi:hypothetical protein
MASQALITQWSLVQIQPPQPNNSSGWKGRLGAAPFAFPGITQELVSVGPTPRIGYWSALHFSAHREELRVISGDHRFRGDWELLDGRDTIILLAAMNSSPPLTQPARGCPR